MTIKSKEQLAGQRGQKVEPEPKKSRLKSLFSTKSKQEE